jgi:hypothetical protein
MTLHTNRLVWKLITVLRQKDPALYKKFSPYRAVNKLILCYKTDQLMPYREIIAVFSQIHTKHINTLCGQNVELLSAKPGGVRSYASTLDCKVCFQKFSSVTISI